MAIPIHALNAYTSALNSGAGLSKVKSATQAGGTNKIADSFSDTLKSSIAKVNDMDLQKSAMIQDFASGDKQNVHELMITLQKAGLAMNMTTTVRNKIMEAYKELTHIQF